MKTRPRFLTSILDAAQAPHSSLPWAHRRSARKKGASKTR